MLRLGLGRAIVFLRQHDARPYRDIILDACTHWTGYDQQVEGTRTPYLMTVLDSTGDLASYVEPILAAFRASTDRRDQQHLIRLTSLVRHPDDRVIHAAANALSQIADPRIRPLALDVLANPALSGWRRSSGVDMLLSNFEPGDEALLTGLLTTPRDVNELHWMGMGTLDVLKANPSADAAPVLLALYEHGPCTNCRMDAIEWLGQLGALPDWLLEECRYDASEYLREAADAWARGEEPADA